MSVVAFSGDKLLGGPQAGIIVGKREIIERIRRNPLMRALRVDKMTYAALEATLRLYERGAAATRVPAIHAMAMTAAEIEARAVSLTQRLESLTNGRLLFSLADGVSVIGGGSAPEVRLPTVVIAVRSREMTAEVIAARLRGGPIPIIARTESDLVLLDLRTVAAEEEALLLAALADLAQRAEPDAASLDG
jgi:L-seryl-tRNA(Ser) seleniumtransferase